MDETDTAILSELQKDGRISMAELGKMLDIAPSTVFKRIDKMKNEGVIQGFTIAVNPSLYADHLVAFLTITVDPDEKDRISDFLVAQETVLEVFETLEPSDFIAKVTVTSIAELKNDVLVPLSRLGGVREIKPYITVRKVKDQYWSVRRYD